jgi:glycosyltransferase involved in cell wall biosynthesis
MATSPHGPRFSSLSRSSASSHFPDVICLSHLRWDFVFQRPQHLMIRFARAHRVFFVEEPLDCDGPPGLDVHVRQQGVRVVVPRLPSTTPAADVAPLVARLLRGLFEDFAIRDCLLWYYTPMALEFTRHLSAGAVVYDCMDELSAFAGAPRDMPLREQELLARADVVFTGGQALYERKRNSHRNVHAFPSSVDVAHFARARSHQSEPADQAAIAGPRLGFFGVIDERLDIALLSGLAALRPDWQIVMLGPVTKIDPSALPRAGNIHYLGAKRYEELPDYLSGWDVALLPFARNEATRFISPTKTPEYLAAGLPVVSTSIRDVVRPYGVKGLARIADTPDAFAAAIEAAVAENPVERQRAADAFLTQTSWDGTWTRMFRLVAAALEQREPLHGSAADVSEPGVA